MSEQVVVNEIPDCDFCDESTPAFVDGRTQMGPWANMCETHWQVFGVGQFGTGFGQKLVMAE